MLNTDMYQGTPKDRIPDTLHTPKYRRKGKKEMRSFEEMSFVHVSALQANPTKQALQLNFSLRD